MAILTSVFGRACVGMLVSYLSLTSAAPLNDVHGLDLVRRADGHTENDPIPATFNIAGWTSIAEENCFIALCILGGRRVYQRNDNSGESDEHRRESGQGNYPFQDQNYERYQVPRFGPSTTSAEEFPWASIKDHPSGAWQRHIVSATIDEQNAQKIGVSAGFSSAVPFSRWFTLTFSPASSFGKYCTALHSNPPDTSVCGEKKRITQELFNLGKKVAIAGMVVHRVKNGNKVNFGISGKRAAQDDVLFASSAPADEVVQRREDGAENLLPVGAEVERSENSESREVAYTA
ncbi:hypothetical protein CC86DRAFT_466809 [Ophiobolus disseminans]|uniref:Uncharacterized protein n=1 Tax=Ophiobolus disseminans TaxID=1469910 RepID=A0A6A7A2Y1_9PLEO|nr:hypothetical protein CC86DRAFT_466809 [Ophiobolus disseminans]